MTNPRQSKVLAYIRTNGPTTKATLIQEFNWWSDPERQMKAVLDRMTRFNHLIEIKEGVFDLASKHPRKKIDNRNQIELFKI